MPHCARVLLAAVIPLLFFGPIRPIHAQDAVSTPTFDALAEAPPPLYEAVVTDVLAERQSAIAGQRQLYQQLGVRFTTGPLAGRTAVIESGALAEVNMPRYAAGDEVVVAVSLDAEGREVYNIADSVRRRPLVLLFLGFVALTVVVGRKRGVASLVGMALSFVIIFRFLLPQVMAGRNPILVAIGAALVIIPLTFYLAHGLNRKTTAAIIGTLIALVVTSVLAEVSISAAKLTGFSSEEAAFLPTAGPGAIDIQGLLLAGIIIGLLGILDDITVSQAAIVYQLGEAASHLGPAEVYRRAMDVGRDHIASLVNTLILVYASSALPLLLLFTGDALPFRQAVNTEVVAAAVVQTLVASIGLILAVPITTAVTCALWARERRRDAATRT
jgi:uncharacterized membrane protein